MKIDQILETCLYVHDLAESRRFYEGLLGLSFYSEAEGRHVFFRLHNGMFLLFNASATMAPDSDFPAHGTAGHGHAAFRVAPEEIPRWRQHLCDSGIPLEKEWTWPNGAPSIYFRDPSGNVLEITTGALWGY